VSPEKPALVAWTYNIPDRFISTSQVAFPKPIVRGGVWGAPR
jgi:hypothetical protein